MPKITLWNVTLSAKSGAGYRDSQPVPWPDPKPAHQSTAYSFNEDFFRRLDSLCI